MFEMSEERKQREAKAIMYVNGLNNLSPEYKDPAELISKKLVSTGFMKASKELTGMNDIQFLQATQLNAIIEQNWIIIRELDKLSKR